MANVVMLKHPLLCNHSSTPSNAPQKSYISMLVLDRGLDADRKKGFLTCEKAIHPKQVKQSISLFLIPPIPRMRS